MTLRAVARRLVGRSYVVSKRYALLRMRGVESPVVVFSMGKTGSTAVARAVQEATGERVFQVFRLESDRLAEAEQREAALKQLLKDVPVTVNSSAACRASFAPARFSS